MKKIITPMMIGLFVLFLSSFLFSQSNEIVEKYSKVKITIQDRSDLKELQQAGLSLEGIRLEEKSVEIILSEREIIKLKNLGYSYKVLIDDISKYYQERSRRTDSEMRNLEKEMKQKCKNGGFGFGSMGGFYTYDEVVAELDTMRMLYPSLITAKYSIGTTLEGRTIWAVKISDNPDVNEGEPEVFYNALIHAREPAGMMAVIYFMYHLLENYGSDPEITYLIDNRELYFVPCINVDGYEYNYQMSPNGGYMWRKNKRDNNGNSTFEEEYDGVDLNRNFAYMWGYNNIGSSPNPSDETYRGSGPFSEPETQVIRDVCNSRNFKLTINFHTHGNLLLYSWGYINSPTPDDDWFAECSSLMVVFNGYEAGQSPIVLYEVNGSADDWMYGEQVAKPKIFAMTPEVGNDNDGFWPPPERIFPLAEENVYLNKVIAWGPGVIDNPSFIFEAEVSPNYCKPQEDSIHIFATESNLGNYNSTMAAYLYDVEDNLIEEFELNEIDTNTYFGTRLAPLEENFYHFLLKSTSTELPSIFYYQKDLKFTTAGPLVVSSVMYIKGTTNYYNIRPFVKNNGTSLTIMNAQIRLYCNDPWVTSVSVTDISLNPIAPGATVGGNTWAAIYYDTASFPGYFNFRAEISDDEFVYWTDSIQVIVTGVEVDELQPLTYELKQNYPNPFNPSTVISYQLRVGGNVSLKIYDILGNEIATLVDEFKSAGRHEVEFKASSFTSGVYYYQLKAGEYLNTKKMILLK
jgi:hypothetical protein